jgi:aerobic C4-dicarboxylate transport protein
MAQVAAAARAPKKPLYKSLYFQVIVAIVAGILLGYFFPDTGAAMKPLGDGFIRLIKMIIAPIIFCTVVVGIAGMEDMKTVGKTGGYALLYFEAVSTLALFVGLVIINLFQPGAGMNIDPATLDTKSIAAYAAPGKMQSTTDFLLNVIPNTVVDAFAKGEILQVLLFSVMFGFALHAFGAKGKPVFEFIDKVSHVLFGIVGMIMRVAPIGAFGAMAFTIGKYGVGSLLSLAKLMGTFYATCLFFILVVLGIIAKLHGFSIWKFIKYIKEELFIVLGTSSSESVLPRMIAKLENLGVKKSVVGLVIPTGYSFNLDGTSIYLTMAAVFIAQATNTPLTLVQQLTLLGVLLRLHRARGDAVCGGRRAGRGPGADSRHRPLHVGSARAYESHRQWRRHGRRRPLVRRGRRRENAPPPRSGDRGRGRSSGAGAGRGGRRRQAEARGAASVTGGRRP